jgi:archaellum component FlaC
MTDEDFEKIRLLMRAELAEALHPLKERLGAVEDRLGAVENRLRAVESRMEGVEDKVEILSGVAIRSDGTAQEVGGIRRMLDHLDRRVRRLEDQTPAE